MASEENEEQFERIREPGWDETYYIDGYGSISGTKTDIIGEIQDYRNKDVFYGYDQPIYDQLVELAKEKGYIGDEAYEEMKSYVPKDGSYQKYIPPKDPKKVTKSYKTSSTDSLTEEEFTNVLDECNRGDVRNFIEEAKDDTYYTEEEVKMMSSLYNEKYGKYNDDYYKTTAQDMSDTYMQKPKKN